MSDKTTPLAPDLIFDVGMHQGEDTEYYLKRGFRVVGFEANPDLVRENSDKYAAQIDRGELVIVEGAIVGDHEGDTVTFYVNEDSSVWGTVNPTFAERNEQLGTRNRVVEVPAVDFGECLERFGVPYFMKIDIEGADHFCLQALHDFTSRPSYLSIESDKVDFARLLREIDMIESLGYDSFKAVQQGNVPGMKVPGDSIEGRVVDHAFSKEASGMFGSDLPGRWLTRDELVREYERIFKQYRLLGDDTFWQQNPVARKLLKGLTRLTGKHYPGWYDTHARYRTVSKGIDD